jgi:hypothetical protein
MGFSYGRGYIYIGLGADLYTKAESGCEAEK